MSTVSTKEIGCWFQKKNFQPAGQGDVLRILGVALKTPGC